MIPLPSWRLRAFPLGLAALLALSACDSADTATASATADAKTDARGGNAPGSRWAGPDTPPLAEVAVMSQNLYLGADLSIVASEQNPNLIPLRVAQLYGTVQRSDVPARMAAIASEIARIHPALVGLQEVTTYSIQSTSDYITGTITPNATNETFNFLELLLAALEAEGVQYEVASISENSDVELPATTDGQTFFDVRYQDADVILARQGVSTSNSQETVFQTLLTVNVGGVPQTFTRSYQSVDATVDGYTFTFVNTHLEIEEVAPIRDAQAQELGGVIDRIHGPVVLVGDLNARPDAPAYAALTGLLADVFARPNLKAEPTCCQAADLLNPVSLLDRRIDYVLYRGFDRAQKAETVLDEPDDRVLSNGRLLWPTDHAGVAALLVHNLRRARPNA